MSINKMKCNKYDSACIYNSLIYLYKESPNSENQEYGNILLAIITDHTYICVPYLPLKYK